MDINIIGYLFQGIGILIGIVIGTMVTLIAQWFVQRQKENETLKYLKFEIDLNITKIDRWLEEINNYRNAVNSDTLNIYFGYFDLARVATNFYYNTFYSGLLYKYLDFESINELQVIFSEFVQSWETIINGEVKENRDIFVNKSVKFDKPAVTQKINFWENKFKTHKKTLQKIRKLFEEN